MCGGQNFSPDCFLIKNLSLKTLLWSVVVIYLFIVWEISTASAYYVTCDYTMLQHETSTTEPVFVNV
jgi:hypothetical protein